MSISGNQNGNLQNITNEDSYVDLESRIETNEENIYNLQIAVQDLETSLSDHESRISVNEVKLTDINYTTDTTTINNNVVVSSGKTLTVNGLNVKSQIDTNTSNISAINTVMSGITYDSGNDITTVENRVIIKSNSDNGYSSHLKLESDSAYTSYQKSLLFLCGMTAGSYSPYVSTGDMCLIAQNNSHNITTDPYVNGFVIASHNNSKRGCRIDLSGSGTTEFNCNKITLNGVDVLTTSDLTSVDSRLDTLEYNMNDITFNGSDVTTFQNSVNIVSGKNLTVDGLNIKPQIDTNTTNIWTNSNDIATTNVKLTNYSYNAGTATTTINNHFSTAGNNLSAGVITGTTSLNTPTLNATDIASSNVVTNYVYANTISLGGSDLSTTLSSINSSTTGLTYSAVGDLTTLDNNLTLNGKNLTVNNITSTGAITVGGYNVTTQFDTIASFKYLTNGFAKGTFTPFNTTSASNFISASNTVTYGSYLVTTELSGSEYGLKFLHTGVHKLVYSWVQTKGSNFNPNTSTTLNARFNTLNSTSYSPISFDNTYTITPAGNASAPTTGYTSFNSDNMLQFIDTSDLWQMEFLIRENVSIQQPNKFSLTMEFYCSANTVIFFQMKSSNGEMATSTGGSKWYVQYLGA